MGGKLFLRIVTHQTHELLLRRKLKISLKLTRVWYSCERQWWDELILIYFLHRLCLLLTLHITH